MVKTIVHSGILAGKKSQSMVFGPQDLETPQPPGFGNPAPRI